MRPRVDISKAFYRHALGVILIALALVAHGDLTPQGDGITIDKLREFAATKPQVEFRHVRNNPSVAGERREVVSFQVDGLHQEESRQAPVYGVRPSRTFAKAAAKFVMENQHKRSLESDIGRLKHLMPWIGDVPLERIHRGTLQPWLEYRQKEGVSTGTINHGLKVVRRILNLASGEWMDEHGLTWLASVPKIKLLPDNNKRRPYPLSWDEQERLFRALPDHLAQMSLFAVNTGCRTGEICKLRWDWEIQVPELKTSVFIIPGEDVKNGDERLVVLNRVAKSVVDSERGNHDMNVFTFRGRPIKHMLNSGWKLARTRAGLPQVRVHDLKHTFGRRLRAVGVSFEDRQDLLGHRSGRITTHYSAAELSRLLEAANRVCDRKGKQPELVVLRRLNVS